MRITDLQQFFNYHPVYGDAQFLVDEIIARTSKYLQPKDYVKIQETYEFAKLAHGGWLRLSGEPYIVHPLQATLFLVDLMPDLPTIQACILHDVIEDTKVSSEEIEKIFWKEVADLCEGMVKVSKVKYRGEERQIETLKKTFLAMWKDLRVIFIKLVDRIHNIQTLQYHPKEEKRTRIANETLKIYVAIAKRLGLFSFQQLLENGAFRVLHPKEFAAIMQFLEKKFANEDVIQSGIKKLQNLLSLEQVPFFSIVWRFKSPYRIWEKMINKYHSMDFENINDVIAFRVLTKTVGDCYNILGVIHHHYIPLIKKIKDYIAVPKFNGYQSLHTTVLGLYDFPAEIQIRTKEMDEIADRWVAAHFAYAENKWPASVSERQSRWIKKLQELVSAYTTNDDKEWFKNELNIELLEHNIFIYTQKWDVIELPEWSTVLDFAFRVHSELWLKFQSALVNGSIVPISHKLKTGDIVLVHAFKNKWSASGNWLEYLHTPSAKSKLTRFLKSKEKTQLINKSLKLLEEKLKEFKLPALYSKWDLITKEHKWEAFDRLLLQLLDKQMWYTTFIKKIYHKILPPDEKSPHKKISAGEKMPEVMIDGGLRLGYLLCPECKPTPADKIIARSGKDGIKIHTLSCRGVASVAPEKFLEAHREAQESTMYNCYMRLWTFDNSSAVLLKIFDVYASLGFNLEKIEYVRDTDGTSKYVDINSVTSYPAKIAYLLQELKKHSKIVKVIKREIS